VFVIGGHVTGVSENTASFVPNQRIPNTIKDTREPTKKTRAANDRDVWNNLNDPPAITNIANTI
jgi:hypothetical protein